MRYTPQKRQTDLYFLASTHKQAEKKPNGGEIGYKSFLWTCRRYVTIQFVERTIGRDERQKMSEVGWSLSVIGFLAASVFFALQWHRVKRRLEREAYIRSFKFPLGATARIGNKYPSLSPQDLESVSHGLRHFFLAHLKSGFATIAMPSQVVSDLWQEFILHEREYQVFMEKAFGRMLHHTAASMPIGDEAEKTDWALCWQHACREEKIDPDAPGRLPLLFALDEKLKIENGLRYRLEGNRFSYDSSSAR